MSHRKTGPGGALLIASDLHGNTSQYDRIFTHALERDCGGVILCGDITPKGALFNARGQKAFLTDYLFPKIQSVHRQRGRLLPIFLMMGNDDLKPNEHILLENQERHKYTYIHNRGVPFGDFFIAGYSCVPPTPHGCKDWEKTDGSRAFADRGSFRTEGWRSRGEERMPCVIGGNSTIARDLEKMFSGFSSFDKTVFVSHAPPYGSKLDMLGKDRQHVGSMAIREFLSCHRPMISVHGHIHETVSVSGSWHDRVSEEGGLSLAVGNCHHDPAPQVILLKIMETGPVVQRMQLTGIEAEAASGMVALIAYTSGSVSHLKRKLAAMAGGG